MLRDRRLLITAGPTWEAIDPVRGITNHSSGKMGYAIAEQAAELGMEVVLVSGPVCLSPPAGITTLQISSAREMHATVHQQLQAQAVDLFIGVAAVADYRPAEINPQKIKKSTDELTLRLVKNPDIVASVAALDSNRPFTVGFAAETHNLEAYARAKLRNKNLDMIIANDVSEPGTGFGAAHNRVLMITREQSIDSGRQDKAVLARTILLEIAQHLQP